LAQREPDPLPSPPDASRATELGSLQQRVGDALAGLDPRQRRALELAYWNGLSHAKISEELGAPLGTVKSWVRNGLASLRQQIPREEWT
jgi:RNA polymerase sigma-70 factor (ECF subfamily)